MSLSRGQPASPVNEGEAVKKPGPCIIKLITAVIYGFRNKLVFDLKIRTGWKEGLPGTNTLAYNRYRKLRS